MIECKKEYYTNGNISSEIHYKDELIHRDNLPAIIEYNVSGNIESEFYYKEGRYHREDGPAYKCCHLSGYRWDRFYLDGVEYTDKDITDNWEAFCKMQIFR